MRNPFENFEKKKSDSDKSVNLNVLFLKWASVQRDKTTAVVCAAMLVACTACM